MKRNKNYEDYIEEDLEDGLEKGNYLLTTIRVLLFSAVPILLFYLMEAFEHNALIEVRPLAQLYNIFLFELLAWGLFFVTGSGRLALRIETVIALVYGLVNHYVMAFRSTPLVPWDIFSIKTAASVVNNYDFTPTAGLLLVVGAFVLLFLLLHFVKLKFPYGILMRIIPTVCVGLVLSTFVNLLWDEEFQTDSYLYPFLFTPAHMTKVNGMAVTFAMDMAFVYVDKPDGYSVEKAQEILAEYENADPSADEKYEDAGESADGRHEDADTDGNEKADSQPNMIVVMNEAFSDPAVLGDFVVNEDYMPFIHRLQEGNENTVTGNLLVSVCGGNTANSEFEFLTGHTMDYFPVGSIPYQQYITEEIPSLVSHLQEQGYATYGMHPYNASGWQRDEVYPLLGFEQTYFLQDFTGRKYIRNYVSDRSAYDKIIEAYEKKDEGTPLFAFEVTMQNHGGYTDVYKNFTPDVKVEGASSKALNQYLSLLKISDEAFEELVDYFSREDEKTVIVFFGDHQPSDSVVNPILLQNGVKISDMSVEEAELRYQVPYVIWANYDIEEETGADTDISFLAANLLERIHMPTTAYQNFLLELEDVLAVGNTKMQEEYLGKYEILQYYFMFDYEKE